MQRGMPIVYCIYKQYYPLYCHSLSYLNFPFNNHITIVTIDNEGKFPILQGHMIKTQIWQKWKPFIQLGDCFKEKLYWYDPPKLEEFQMVKLDELEIPEVNHSWLKTAKLWSHSRILFLSLAIDNVLECCLSYEMKFLYILSW